MAAPAYAEKGDRLCVHSSYAVLPDREAEVLEVLHADGSPPYRVRWSDTGREALVMPGPDCVVEHSRGTDQWQDHDERKS